MEADKPLEVSVLWYTLSCNELTQFLAYHAFVIARFLDQLDEEWYTSVNAQ